MTIKLTSGQTGSKPSGQGTNRTNPAAMGTTLRAFTAGAVLALAGTAGAQIEVFEDANQSQPAEGASQTPQGVLAGPAVEQGDKPGRRAKFGEPAGQSGERAQARQFRGLLTGVRVLGSERTPEELRLTEAQQERVKAVMAAHREQHDAFMLENKARIDELLDAGGISPEEFNERRDRLRTQAQERRSAREAGDETAEDRRERRRSRIQDRARGARPDDTRGAGMEEMGDPMRQSARNAAPAIADRRQAGRAGRAERPEPTPEQAEARRELRELMATGPTVEDAAREIMMVLTPEQREHLQSVRQRLQQRSGDRAGRGQQGEQRRGGERGTERPGQRGSVFDLDLPDPDDSI